MSFGNKINIILDLDNTIISTIDETEEKEMDKTDLKNRTRLLEWKIMKWGVTDERYKIFARPYLQEFLTWLFEYFNVSIWTAASKSYALFVIDEFILRSSENKRNLDYVLFNYHCDKSKKKMKGIKVLSALNEIFNLNYDLNKTFIIDDLAEVYASQPDKCFKIKAFEVSDSECEKDIELKKIMNQLDSLKKLLIKS